MKTFDKKDIALCQLDILDLRGQIEKDLVSSLDEKIVEVLKEAYDIIEYLKKNASN